MQIITLTYRISSLETKKPQICSKKLFSIFYAKLRSVHRQKYKKNLYILWTVNRGVAREGRAGRARAPPEFGRSVNPIRTRVGRFRPSRYCQPPGSKSYLHLWSMMSQPKTLRGLYSFWAFHIYGNTSQILIYSS